MAEAEHWPLPLQSSHSAPHRDELPGAPCSPGSAHMPGSCRSRERSHAAPSRRIRPFGMQDKGSAKDDRTSPPAAANRRAKNLASGRQISQSRQSSTLNDPHQPHQPTFPASLDHAPSLVCKSIQSLAEPSTFCSSNPHSKSLQSSSYISPPHLKLQTRPASTRQGRGRASVGGTFLRRQGSCSGAAAVAGSAPPRMDPHREGRSTDRTRSQTPPLHCWQTDRKAK